METTVGEEVVVIQHDGETQRGTVRSVLEHSIVFQRVDGQLTEIALESIASVRAGAAALANPHEDQEEPHVQEVAANESITGSQAADSLAPVETVSTEELATELLLRTQGGSAPEAGVTSGSVNEGATIQVRQTMQIQHSIDKTVPAYRKAVRIRTLGYVTMGVGLGLVSASSIVRFKGPTLCRDVHTLYDDETCSNSVATPVMIGVGAAAVVSGAVVATIGAKRVVKETRHQFDIRMTASPVVLRDGAGAQIKLDF